MPRPIKPSDATNKLRLSFTIVAALLAFGFYNASDIEKIMIGIAAVVILGLAGGVPSGEHEGELDG